MTATGIINPGSALLLETADLRSPDGLLVFSAGDPALALGAAVRCATRVTVYDFSYSTLRQLEKAAIARRLDNLHLPDGFFPERNAYAVALMCLPKGRDLARAQVWLAAQALRPGGRLYLAGPTAGGAKSIFDDAATLFGKCVTLAIKQRHRVGVSICPERLPAYPWDFDPLAPQQRIFGTPAGPIQVATLPGVFSWDHLDEGTAFLLEHLMLEPGQTVLDVGCGNGIIGAFTARSAGYVCMVDDNRLAVHCARQTIALNRLANASACVGDVYDTLHGRTFDLIVSNPPFHRQFEIDSSVTLRMLSGAKDMLRPGGRLVIVANAFLKYKDHMARHFPQVRVLARNSTYAVIEGRVSA